MKRSFFFILILLAYANLQGQDIIQLKDGTSINGKVIEIGIEEVKYKKQNNSEGPSYAIKKSDVNKITYPGGQEEVINKQEGVIDRTVTPEPGLTPYEILKKHESAVTGEKGLSSLKSASYSYLYHYRENATALIHNWNIHHISKYGQSKYWDTGKKEVVTIDGSWSFYGDDKNGYDLTKGYPFPSPSQTGHVYADFGMLILLTENRSSINYVGVEVQGHSKLYRFKTPTLLGNGELHTWLDGNTYLPVKQVLYIDNKENMFTTVDSAVTQEGYWFPVIVTTRYQQNGAVGLQRIRNLEVNKDLTGHFEVPDVKAMNAKVNRRKEIPLDKFLEFKEDDDMTDIVRYLKDSNINDSLFNNGLYDFIRIGQNEMERIKLADLPDLEYSFVEFGFVNKKLKSIALAINTNSYLDFSEDDQERKFVDRCLKMDAFLSGKNGTSPVAEKYWYLPSRYPIDKVFEKQRKYNKIKAGLKGITLNTFRIQWLRYQHLIIGDGSVAYRSSSIMKSVTL